MSDINWVWVAERATGLTALALLALATALGAMVSAHWSSRRFPELMQVTVHRNISLLSLAFLGVHVIGVVIDEYVDVSLLSVFIPFTAAYKPLYVGFGAIALDLFLAVLITSMLRGRINARGWRIIHDLTYLCWAAGTVHALGAAYERQLTFFVAVAGIVVVVPTAAWRYVRPARRRLPVTTPGAVTTPGD